MQLDTSAIMWSAPERERATRPLLVLLHGYGSHEGDLFSMSPALPLGAVIASVRAPILQPPGFSWFPIEGPADEAVAAVDAAAHALIDWLDTLQYTSVSLVGFSQGAAMALQLLRLAPRRFAATVALSGFVASEDHPGDAELARVRPAVFWGRGTEDEVIRPELIERTERWLPAHTETTVNIYENLAHSISTPELGDFTRFLREHP